MDRAGAEGGVWPVIILIMVTIIARLYFRQHRLRQWQRTTLVIVALLLMATWCVRTNEFGIAPWCMLGFGAFVLIASLLFLRRFDQKSSNKS